MSYINRKSKVFMVGEKKITPHKRSEARLKTYFSATDTRAWSDIVEERRQHILEYTAESKGFCLEKYIPLEIMFKVMMAGKNTETNTIRKKMECLEKVIDLYSNIELTEDQQEKLNKMRSEVEKAHGKLECLQDVTDTHNGENSDVNAENTSDISHSSTDPKTTKESIISHGCIDPETNKMRESCPRVEEALFRNSIGGRNSKVNVTFCDVENTDKISEPTEISEETQLTNSNVKPHSKRGCSCRDIDLMTDKRRESCVTRTNKISEPNEITDETLLRNISVETNSKINIISFYIVDPLLDSICKPIETSDETQCTNSNLEFNSKRENITPHRCIDQKTNKISVSTKISEETQFTDSNVTPNSKREIIVTYRSIDPKTGKISLPTEILEETQFTNSNVKPICNCKSTDQETYNTENSEETIVEPCGEGEGIPEETQFTNSNVEHKSKRVSTISHNIFKSTTNILNETNEILIEIETSKISKGTQFTNADSNNSENKLIGTEELKCRHQNEYCELISPCEIEKNERMRKELDVLRSKSKEAEMLKLERDKLQIQLNELSYLQVQYDNLRLKCCCLESAAQERDIYKQKYAEVACMGNECEELRLQLDAAKDLTIERDFLVKQVCELEAYIGKQEEEIKLLVALIDNLTLNNDELQSHTSDALEAMKADVEKKDHDIAMLEEILPNTEAKLKLSVQRISCQMKCLKLRIEELEGELEKYQTENEQLKRKVTDNNSSLTGAMQLVKREYEALTAMKQELEAAKVENKKLQQIANKMIALTGDEHIKKVLNQSKCAVNRAVEELRKQYKHWNDLRCTKKDCVCVTEADCNKISGTCEIKGVTEFDSNKNLREAVVEKLRTQYKEWSEMRCTRKKNGLTDTGSKKTSYICETKDVAQSGSNDNSKQAPVEGLQKQCKKDGCTKTGSTKLKYTCEIKGGTESDNSKNLKEAPVEGLRKQYKECDDLHHNKKKDGFTETSSNTLKYICSIKGITESDSKKNLKEAAVEELRKERKQCDEPKCIKKKDGVTETSLDKLRYICETESDSDENLKDALAEIQREKEKLEKLVDHIKNDELICGPQQLIYSFKNSLCTFTRMIADDDKMSGKRIL